MPKASTSPHSGLSELEGGVLGIVSGAPGSTAHGVREQFRLSRSSHWSGSAGAIYPLMKKLHERGLLTAEESQRGTGVRRSYSISATGSKELKRWLGPPLPEWVASVTFDPLRTRMSFLDALSPAKQESFLVEAERMLTEELQETREELDHVRETGSFWEVVTGEGCQAITQARLRWIRRILEALRES